MIVLNLDWSAGDWPEQIEELGIFVRGGWYDGTASRDFESAHVRIEVSEDKSPKTHRWFQWPSWL